MMHLPGVLFHSRASQTRVILGHSKCWGSFLEAHTLGKLFPRIRATRPSLGTKFPCESMDQG